ncbi:type II secretion system F family protein [Paracoccus sp. Z118]|uniref:type II secretion system F family protein n=1 Tax=Paracoccus sp. Z118 TaxID=2851017 RepID=UPI001C2BE457|nr:type II secretion system F family protein [Paracoccus sp. Z118]MBV0893413.1 type II secretion system F family protein [Paracoccus sp. Z118]
MSPTVHSFLVFLLSALSVACLLYAVFVPRFRHEARMKTRLRLAAGATADLPRQASGAGKSRKRSIEETLKQMEEKQKENARTSSSPSLTERLRQSGLGWSRTTYAGIGLAVGLTSHALFEFGFGFRPGAAAIMGIAMALLLPHLYVGYERSRRLLAFRNELPNAVDVIVRGVRSGLPLGDCLRLIAAEGQEPVRSEFKTAVDDQTLGVPLPDAMLRLADRVPVPEAGFLATVIAIQSRSGGNLTEALANLSSVLRERKKMRAKIKALSSEAKASAGIIGSLPPAVAGLLYLTSPQYISLLFTTTTGHVVLAASAVWMSIGILVMRAMINFDF